MMTVKLLALLLCLFTFLTGVCSWRPREIHVKAGELVALHCPRYRGHKQGETKLFWTSHTSQKTYVTNNMSSAELMKMGVLIYRRNLVILSASVNHQGNYSCSVGKASSQICFTLTVSAAQSKEYEEETQYPKTCYTQESCKLNCPDVNIPALNTPNLTSNGITWRKEGESLPTRGYFRSVEEKDRGVYTCTRSYLYHGQIYSRTFTVALDVQPKQIMQTAVIMSPHNKEVFHVDLGSRVVIDCKAVMYSDFDEVFWLSGESFVDKNHTLPVFYKCTRESNLEEIKMTASLIFKKVSEEDLSKNYTCKLESVYQKSSFVTITLAQRSLILYKGPCFLGSPAASGPCFKSRGGSLDYCLVLHLGDSEGVYTAATMSRYSSSFTFITSHHCREMHYCNSAKLCGGLFRQITLLTILLIVWCAVLQAVMIVKVLLVTVFLLLTSKSDVCHLRPKESCVKAGEMVVVQCTTTSRNGNDKPIWTSDTTQKMDLTNMSSAEQRQMGVLVHGMSLVILSASVDHQGNYSCFLGNASSQVCFTLTVSAAESKKCEEETQYPKTCYTQESCKLNCPDVNIPAVNTLNLTDNGITWLKEGESLPTRGYFRSVEEKDRGVYTCTRSYLYHGQIYNRTFTVALRVQPKQIMQTAVIMSPHNKEVFHVDLGSRVVIDCKAVMYSDFDEVFWLSGESFVDKNHTLPVFYKCTRESNLEEIKMTASLVFKKVSEEDLSKNYTCKLESVYQKSSFVTITLAQHQKAHPSYISLALSIVGIVLVMLVTVIIYVKLKIDITLFIRDTLGFHSSSSDGKNYDAFLMSYESHTDAGLNAHDRKCLESVLEDRFGYNLCLYDRDILPGEAVAKAVLDCIEQSRAVVLVPTSADPGLGSGLLSAIHEALVERQTRLIFIKTETTEVSTSGSLSEALQLLSEAGDCVTWKGKSSLPPSSSFWKRLRYYLPASQHAPKIRILSQTSQDVISL
ncbi:interleukin-18 receptor 1-like [Toxotes jaculatrix]|uniref:interleukin-18 receptor 1-like n=1 Tax=Toxotes jaculatrix TaxID=941984 RepID=UPI001B3AAD53|nr:interleukin-18 receptor 1-like [Toxotes jaculatrix]